MSNTASLKKEYAERIAPALKSFPWREWCDYYHY